MMVGVGAVSSTSATCFGAAGAAKRAATASVSTASAEGGLHRVSAYGDRVDISQAAVMLSQQPGALTVYQPEQPTPQPLLGPLSSGNWMWRKTGGEFVHASAGRDRVLGLGGSGIGDVRSVLQQGQRDLGGRIEALLKKNSITLNGKEVLQIAVTADGQVKVSGVGEGKAKKIATLVGGDAELVRGLQRQAAVGDAGLSAGGPSPQSRRILMDEMLQSALGVGLDEFDLDALTPEAIEAATDQLGPGWASEARRAQETVADSGTLATFSYRNGIMLDSRIALDEKLDDPLSAGASTGRPASFDPFAAALSFKQGAPNAFALEQLNIQLQYEYGAGDGSAPMAEAVNGLKQRQARGETGDGDAPPGGEEEVRTRHRERSERLNAWPSGDTAAGGAAFSAYVDADGALRIGAGAGAPAGIVELANQLDAFASEADSFKEQYEQARDKKDPLNWRAGTAWNPELSKILREALAAGRIGQPKASSDGKAAAEAGDGKDRSPALAAAAGVKIDPDHPSQKISNAAADTLRGVFGRNESVLPALQSGVESLSARIGQLLEENGIFPDPEEKMEITVNPLGEVEVSGLEDKDQAKKIARIIGRDEVLVKELTIQAYAGDWQLRGGGAEPGQSGFTGDRLLMDEFLQREAGFSLDELDERLRRMSPEQREEFEEKLEKMAPGFLEDAKAAQFAPPDPEAKQSFSYQYGRLNDNRVDTLEKEGTVAEKLRGDSVKTRIEEEELKPEEARDRETLEGLGETVSAEEDESAAPADTDASATADVDSPREQGGETANAESA